MEFWVGQSVRVLPGQYGEGEVGIIQYFASGNRMVLVEFPDGSEAHYWLTWLEPLESSNAP